METNIRANINLFLGVGRGGSFFLVEFPGPSTFLMVSPQLRDRADRMPKPGRDMKKEGSGSARKRQKTVSPRQAGSAGTREHPASQLAAWTEREHPEWLDAAAWGEWRALCALGLCPAAVKQALMGFAEFHFRRFIRRYAFRTNTPAEGAMLSARDSWHLLETHMTARQNRDGKRYKDWLFGRVPPDSPSPMRAVAGGAVLLMREAAREFLIRETAPVRQVSLSSPFTPDGTGTLTLEDLLPDMVSPSDEVARREYEALAREYAEEWFAALGARDRVILLARHLGLPLNHPLVEQAAGCRKSKAFAALKSLVETLGADLKKQYPEDPLESLRLLAVLTLEALHQRVQGWAQSEPRCAELLTLAMTYEETSLH